MKNFVFILLVIFASSCKNSPSPTVAIQHEQNETTKDVDMIVKQYCVYDNIAAYFVLVTNSGESQWDLMSEASKELTSSTFKENKDVTRVIIMYYDNEKFMPPQKPDSKDHVLGIVSKSLISSFMEDRLIGYTEAENRKSSAEVIQYPIKFLHEQAKQKAIESMK